MSKEALVIASGNLAAPRRTVMGLLGQMGFLDISGELAVSIFNDAGLPARALDEPDFPISLQQDLSIFLAMLGELESGRSPITLVFAMAQEIGINHFGVLGLAMQHADSMVDALKLLLAYPQLSWGHCRVLMLKAPQAITTTYSMDRPSENTAAEEDVDRLVEYCVAMDIVSSVRIVDDIMGGDFTPDRITLPFHQPHDWTQDRLFTPCPIEFGAEQASLVYPVGAEAAQPVHANPLAFRSYRAITEKLSLMLADEISLSERVSRWLWAYSTPLKRGEIAQQLALSERSLARQLKAEGTSYNALFAHVQAERAKNFLRNQALSVTEIAYRLGYTEPAAFTRAFSGWTGKSPRKWREER